MNRVSNWKPVIDRFNSRLSGWKAKCLSFAGRVLLAKAVLGNLPTYFLSLYKAPIQVIKTLEGIRRRFIWGGGSNHKKIRWVAWEKLVASKKNGGLGLGGLREANLALLVKWWWRFREDGKQLWVQVIRAIHGKRWLNGTIPVNKQITGVWKCIGSVGVDFAKRNIDLKNKLICKVGNGNKSRFWEDGWLLDQSLRAVYPLAYKLAANKDTWVSDNYIRVGADTIWSWEWKKHPSNDEEWMQDIGLLIVLRNMSMKTGSDSWVWAAKDENYFSVKQVSSDLLADYGNSTNGSKMVWCNWALPKANMFVWKALTGRIPTRVELVKRGVNVGSRLCPCCGVDDESVEHILLSCSLAKSIWWSVATWLRNNSLLNASSIGDLLNLTVRMKVNKYQKKAAIAIVIATLWLIWSRRNERVFKGKAFVFSKIVEEVKEVTYLWLKLRSKTVISNIQEWLSDGIFSIKM